MAAMGQGQAGGEGGQNGASGEGEAQQGGGPDLSQLAEALGQQGQSLEEMRAFLQSNPWQQGPQETGEDDSTLDLSWLDNPAIDPEQQQQLVQQSVDQLVQQRAQQMIAPVQEQMTNMRRDQQARDLAAEFPELAEEKMAQFVAGPGGLAAQAAQAIGQPQLAAEPAFWRLAYMAHKAAEAANAEQEGSGDPGAATLESGAGSGPGMSGDDLVKQIMEAGGRGASVLDRM